MAVADTPTQLMDAAQALIQERGYNAFSYKDLAEEVGIRTASIHYHFPSKGDLGVAVMGRYQERLEAELARIERTGRSGRARLKAFVRLYAGTEACGAICLCGSLASDLATLPPELGDAVSEYVTRSEGWIASVIREGVEAGEFGFSGRPSEAAATLLAALQGGLLLGRARRASGSLLASVQRVLFLTLDPA